MNAPLPLGATLRPLPARYFCRHTPIDRHAACGAMHAALTWQGQGQDRFARLWSEAHRDTPAGSEARQTLRGLTGIGIELDKGD